MIIRQNVKEKIIIIYFIHQIRKFLNLALLHIIFNAISHISDLLYNNLFFKKKKIKNIFLFRGNGSFYLPYF